MRISELAPVFVGTLTVVAASFLLRASLHAGSQVTRVAIDTEISVAGV